jgi:hypothetical protein
MALFLYSCTCAQVMVCEDCLPWRQRADELQTRLRVLQANTETETVALHRRYHAELDASAAEARRLAFSRNELLLAQDELQRRLRSEAELAASNAAALDDANREIDRLLLVQRTLEQSISGLLVKENVRHGTDHDASCTRWTQTLPDWELSTATDKVDAAVGADARGLSETPRSSSSVRQSGSLDAAYRRSTSPEARPMFRLHAPLPSLPNSAAELGRKASVCPATTLTFLKRKSNSIASTGRTASRRSSTPFLSTSRGVSVAAETPREAGRGVQWWSSAARSSSPASTSAATARAAAARDSPVREPSSRAPSGGTSHSRLFTACKAALPPGALEKKFATLRNAFAELRGLVLRADASMFVTLASVHTLRDCGCPLKLSIAKIKQTILAGCPQLSRRIRDGSKWDVQRSDLMGLGEAAAGPIAASLREMVAAHDYLRYHQRTEALQSAMNEVYENVDLWIELARSRRVQLIVN